MRSWPGSSPSCSPHEEPGSRSGSSRGALADAVWRYAMRELTADDIEALAVGAWILGTGGGGSPYHALLNMRRLYRKGIRVSLMDPQALDDDDDAAVVSNMGAPLVTQERLTDSRMIARAAGWKWMERTSRKVCTEFGSVASTCNAPRRGAEVKRWGILGTTTKAIRLGQAVMEANRRHQDPIATILRAERGKRLFDGKIVEVERRTTEGFLRGRTAIEGQGRIRIDFQN